MAINDLDNKITQQDHLNKSTRINGMSDGGSSNETYGLNITSEIAKNADDSSYKALRHYHNLYDRNELDMFNKTYRFGVFNPYGSLTTTREFLFFTKPDLNIYKRNEPAGDLQNEVDPLLPELKYIPYWNNLHKTKSRIIKLLQDSVSYPKADRFNHLLQNMVVSNLDIPGLEAETVDTPNNSYGVGYSYRGSSEASDDSFDFSLEFKDNKWLDVYHFFKTYEEYETLKHHGTIRPFIKYIENRIIHDQFSIYKFLVDEDMETIIYYGKFFGVMPKSLPRDVFSTANFDNGLSYSISFKAAFYEDMKPEILADFNTLSKEYYDSLPYQIDIYNTIFGRVDSRPAQAAYIEKVASNNSPDGFVYKLRWKGSDKV